MLSRRWPRHPRVRALGISLLILSLVHAPWPQADFHNVRHQDGPGQVCEYHDHLLRWHPDASQAEDVAVLHWHWFLPSSTPVEPGHAGFGPQLHAYVAGWDATAPDSGPVVVPDRSSRTLDLPDRGALVEALILPFDLPSTLGGLHPDPGSARSFGATVARGGSLASWLQRWSC